MGVAGHLLFFILSIAGGLVLYSGLASVLYGNLFDACLRADPLTDTFASIPASDWQTGKQLSDGQVFALLDNYQLLTDEEQTPIALKAPGSPNSPVLQALLSLKRSDIKSGSSLAWRVARANRVLNPATKNQVGSNQGALGCNDDVSLCERYYDARVAAAIAQLPSIGGVAGRHLQLDGTKSVAEQIDANGLHSFFVPTGNQDSSRVLKWAARFRNGVSNCLYLARMERPSPEASPAEIAAGISNWWPEPNDAPNDWAKLVQRKKVQNFLAVLLAKTRSSADVRASRVWVNGLIGWERLAVIILGIFFAFLLLQRALVRAKHERAKKDISNRLFALAESGKQWTTLKERLQDSQRVLNNVCEYSDTVPYRILSAAVEQMGARQAADDMGATLPAGDYVGIRAAQERQELDSSRTMFDVLLPTFPAIGFIGTVSSLLVAMSQADRIVSTTDAFAKGLAASQVTDILSLCFSTTLLALCAVLLFSPLSVLQQSKEHNLVDDIHRLVEVALRPGQ